MKPMLSPHAAVVASALCLLGVFTAGCADSSDAGCALPRDCDDGVFCNGEERCVQGVCEPSLDTAPCPDDGLFCNGVESCSETERACIDTGDPCAASPDRSCVESLRECAPQLDLIAWVELFVNALPPTGSNGYASPDTTELDTFSAAVTAALADDLDGARLNAEAVGYTVEVFLDGAAGDVLGPVIALVPGEGNTDGRGAFFLRPAAGVTRSLVLEAPHPGFETGTAVLAARGFLALGARGLAVAGSHRCANALLTPCDGTTTVCNSGVLGPYRESDMAHQDRSFFQRFHELASEDLPGATLSMSIHGMASAADDPEFTVSDGTSTDSGDAQWTSNRLAAELEARAQADGGTKPGNSCNLAGQDNRLCGGTNTQGRFTNGVASEQVCTSSTATASERFLHLELSYTLRDPADAPHPSVVIESIRAVIPAAP